jgi:ABC-type bacteriocin/lantibiotic exporter with double-glycine peptidase domain
MTGAKLAVRPFKRLSGTTPKNGTNDAGLISAIKTVGIDVKELLCSYGHARRALLQHLRRGGSAILLTESGAHWEAAIGSIGSRVLVFDSDTRGLVVLGAEDLKKRWTSWGRRGRYCLLLSPRRVKSASHLKVNRPSSGGDIAL